MPSKRIDELTTRTVVNTDLLPPTPSGGPSGSATVAAVVKAGLQQPNSASAGAGADITIKAADGVTSGAGGSIILQPGVQATTGGNGYILLKFGSDLVNQAALMTLSNSNEIQFKRGENSSFANVVVQEIIAGGTSGSMNARTNSGNSGFEIRNTWGYAWSPSSPGAAGPDTSIRRAAARVVQLCAGTTSGQGGTISSVPISPSQIVADQNNYSPGTARFYRLSTDASRNITGLSVSQADGQECEVWNVGSNNIVLQHQNTSSTAANRFICSGAADITLAADEVALLRYDSATGRWRVRKV